VVKTRAEEIIEDEAPEAPEMEGEEGEEGEEASGDSDSDGGEPKEE